jgi:hypothetical protein
MQILFLDKLADDMALELGLKLSHLLSGLFR